MFLYIFMNVLILTLYTGSACVKSGAASHDIDEMSTNRTVLLGLKENQWETVGWAPRRNGVPDNTNLRGWCQRAEPWKVELDQKTAKHSTHGCGTQLPLQARNSFQIVLLSATT
ncbi:hypothetical protein NC653_010923 [Populus alba x Populus x berolinensis]|uniref:Secreted protein n=1 Tax=Populus alba x Populus x berolinensis TaxID=444605 RepID=A0AAD6R285_9ROSI|nr:hypothetical protein NC653_010916 [Populus alba x Populus x berolinensis]KAJ7000289.1 hypothetical protein NC653_010923 [Populus alba x Populus x berolinensis]